MPLPVAHSLAGIAIQQANWLPFFERPWQTALFFVAVANLADLDYLPGLLIGNANAFHSGISHTPAAAAAVGIAAGFWFSRNHGQFWAYASLIALTYYSHVLLDHFNQDGRFPYGVMLFWPLSESYFMSPWAFFSAPTKSSDASQFVASVLSWHNMKLAVYEALIMLPFVAAVYWRRRRQNDKPPSPERSGEHDQHGNTGR